MKICWVDEQTATVSECPNVTVCFADTEDESLIDIILGMLLQSFSK
jgi:hypothetical protein